MFEIRFDGALYETCGEDICSLFYISGNRDHFKVPSAVFSKDGKRYRVIKLSPFIGEAKFNIMSFDESLEATDVDISLIRQCRSVFTLPPRIKRVRYERDYFAGNFPKIACENGQQRFVSTAGSRVIMNHFPLELAYQLSFAHKFSIRETIRFVGRSAFLDNKTVRTVVFPSSVEYIGKSGFNGCCSLRFIKFRRNSRLKKIGEFSFRSTTLESVDIPSSVEEIGEYAFESCSELRTVTFSDDSNLKTIGKCSFKFTAIESFDVPINVEEIGKYSFSGCRNLTLVTYHDKSKISFGNNVFYGCRNLKL